MHEAIQRSDLARLSHSRHRFSRWVRRFAIGLCVAVIATLLPSLSYAGMIFEFDAGHIANSQPVVSEAFAESLSEGLAAGSGALKASDQPALETQQQEPENRHQKVPRVEPAMDLDEGDTTSSSAPIPGGGSSAPAAVATDAVVVATAAHMHLIRILEDLILDSPSPLGLLDPPKA
jgi:hypothetical protein